MNDDDENYWTVRHAVYTALKASSLGSRPALTVATIFANFSETGQAVPSISELRTFVEEALLDARISINNTRNFGRKSFNELIAWLGPTSKLLQCPCCESFLWLESNYAGSQLHKVRA